MYWNLLKEAVRLESADSLSSLSGGKVYLSPGGSNELSDSQIGSAGMKEVHSLHERFGADDDRTQSQLYVEVNMCLFESMKAFVMGDYVATHQNLVTLQQSANQFASRAALAHFTFSINRLRAVGYYLENNLEMCVECLNLCVGACPKLGGNQAPGLADVLVLLSEVYTSLGFNEEALHSARLCVDVALTRLEHFEKTTGTSSNAMKTFSDDTGRGSKFFDRSIGPTLDEYTAMAAAYQTLGQQLKSQGEHMLAVEWIHRAMNTATKFGLDFSYVTELRQLLERTRAAAPDSSDGSNGNKSNGGIDDFGLEVDEPLFGAGDGVGHDLAQQQKTGSSSGKRRWTSDQAAATYNVTSGDVDPNSGSDAVWVGGDRVANNSNSSSSSRGPGGGLIINTEAEYLPPAAGTSGEQPLSTKSRPKSAIGKLGEYYQPTPGRGGGIGDRGDQRRGGGDRVAFSSSSPQQQGVVIGSFARPGSAFSGSGGVVAMVPVASTGGKLISSSARKNKNADRAKSAGYVSTRGATHGGGSSQQAPSDYRVQYVQQQQPVQYGHASSPEVSNRQQEQQQFMGSSSPDGHSSYNNYNSGSLDGAHPYQLASDYEGGRVGYTNYAPRHQHQIEYNNNYNRSQTAGPLDIHRLQRQAYGYSARDIMDGIVVPDGAAAGGSGGAGSYSGNRDSSDYGKRPASTAAAAVHAAPGKMDARNVIERTIGRSSTVQKEIDRAARNRSKEREEAREKNRKKAAMRLKEYKKSLEQEKLNIIAHREVHLEQMEMERQRISDLSEAQQKAIRDANEEKEEAERKAARMAAQLAKERTASRESREKAERSLAAEKIRLEVEMSKRLRIEMETLKKAEHKREQAFRKQQTKLELLAAEVKLEAAAPANMDGNDPQVEDKDVDPSTGRDTCAIPGSVLRLGASEGKRVDTDVTASAPKPRKHNEKATASDNKKASSRTRTAPGVKSLPVGKEPPVPAASQRRTMAKAMQSYMTKVKSDAAARADATGKSIQKLHRTSATAIQRVIRGVLCRSDDKLREALTRALRLRRRERELEQMESTLREKERQVAEVQRSTDELYQSAADLQRMGMTYGQQVRDDDDNRLVVSPPHSRGPAARPQGHARTASSGGGYSEDILFQIDSPLSGQSSHVSSVIAAAVGVTVTAVGSAKTRLTSPEHLRSSQPQSLGERSQRISVEDSDSNNGLEIEVSSPVGADDSTLLVGVDVPAAVASKSPAQQPSQHHQSLISPPQSALDTTSVDSSTHEKQPRSWSRKLSNFLGLSTDNIDASGADVSASEKAGSAESVASTVDVPTPSSPDLQDNEKKREVPRAVDSSGRAVAADPPAVANKPAFSSALAPIITTNLAEPVKMKVQPGVPPPMLPELKIALTAMRPDFDKIVQEAESYMPKGAGIASVIQSSSALLKRVEDRSAANHDDYNSDDDDDAATDLLSAIERMLSLSDMYKREKAHLNALVARDRALRFHLQLQREHPGAPSIPNTVDHMRNMFIAKGSQSSTRVTDERMVATTKKVNRRPVEYTMEIYNFLMHAAFAEDLQWLVEAYYREAIELKYDFRCTVGRSTTELVIPEPKSLSKRYLSTVPLPAVVTQIDVLQRKMERAKDDTNRPVMEARFASMCEQAATILLSQNAVLQAIGKRERALRAMQAPPLAYSVRLLGNLGVLSRITGHHKKAKDYFSEMMVIGKVLTMGAAAMVDPSADHDKNTVYGVNVDLAYYKAHFADLLRLSGHHRQASELLQEACPVLERFLGSEYEHYATAAAKRAHHLSLVGCETEIAAFMDLPSAMPPCCDNLDLATASLLAPTIPVDHTATLDIGGKCRGSLLDTRWVLPSSNAAGMLYSSPGHPDNTNTDANKAHNKRREVLDHALHVINTDPVLVLDKDTFESENSSGRNTPMSLSIKRLMDKSNAAARNRAISPTNEVAKKLEERRKEQEARELYELNWENEHQHYGQLLRSHKLSHYIYEVTHPSEKLAKKQRVLDIDHLRSNVCHLLDPSCSLGLTVLSHMDIESCLRQERENTYSLPTRTLFTPMQPGQRPLDSEWPEDCPTEDEKEHFFCADSVDGRSIASEMKIGITTSFNALGVDASPTGNAVSRDSSRPDAFGAGGPGGPSFDLAMANVHTLPVFDLDPTSLLNRHKMTPMFDYDISGMRAADLLEDEQIKGIEKELSRKGAAVQGHFDWQALEAEDLIPGAPEAAAGGGGGGKGKRSATPQLADFDASAALTLAVRMHGEGWVLPFSEESMARLASSGEWVKFRLLPSAFQDDPQGRPLNELKPVRIPRGINSPSPQVWVRSSVIFLGTLLDRFSRIWSVHADWAAHHIINAAAIEETISLAIIDGIVATKRGPRGLGGQEKASSHLSSLHSTSTKAMLPTKKSSSKIHLHLGRSSRRTGWNHLSHETTRPKSQSERHAMSGGGGGIISTLMVPGAAGAGLDPDSEAASGSSSIASTIPGIDAAGHPWEASSHTSNHGSSINNEARPLVVGDGHLAHSDRTSEVEYVFQACRQSYLECHVDASRAESLLKKSLKRWELDPRRQGSTLYDRATMGEGEYKKKLPPFAAETLVGHKLRELATGMYTLLFHMATLDASNSKGLAVGKTPSICLQNGEWNKVYKVAWNSVQKPIIDCLQLLIDSAGIDFGVRVEDVAGVDPASIDAKMHPAAAKLREVVNIASVACQLGTVGALEKLRAFNWKAFRKNKVKVWDKLISMERMDEFVKHAEALVYAPLRDDEKAMVRQLMNSCDTGLDDWPQGRAPSKTNMKTGDTHRSEHKGVGSTHGVSLPLTPIYIKTDDPLVTGMLEIISENVASTFSPRQDMLDRAAGAGEIACAQQ